MQLVSFVGFIKVCFVMCFLGLLGCATTEMRGPNSEQKVVFTSNLNVAKEVLFFGNPSTASAVKEFMKQLDQINANLSAADMVKARVMLELPTDYSTGEVPNPETVINDLDLKSLNFTYKAADLPNSKKHFIAYVSTIDKMASSLWLQDFGEFYYLNEQPTFLDLDYSDLDETSEFHRYVRSSKGLQGKVDIHFRAKRDENTMDTTLEGGDIETLPNGVVLVGNLVHPKLESYFTENLKQKVLRVPADFVATGHVDEVFSIIPASKEKTNGCGYALAHIDPIYGLRLALDRELKHQQTHMRSDFIKALSYFTDANGEQQIHRDHFQNIPKNFKKDKLLSVTEQPWGLSPDFAQWYVHRMVTIHNEVQKGIALIKENLKDSCANLKTVGLPVLLSDFGAGESTFSEVPVDESMSKKEMSDAFKKAPVYLHLSSVNMVVINKHLLMPVIDDLSTDSWDPEFVNSFQNIYKSVIKTRLMALGVLESELHFVNANAFVANGGSLHCGSAVYRDLKKTVH